MNIDISISGYDLFQQGTAHAVSLPGNIAIAIGDGATAQAGSDVTPMFGDFAFADGDHSSATALGNLSSAFAKGSGDTATAGTVGGSEYFDSASVIGTNSTASATNGSFDFAGVGCDNSTATASNGNADIAAIITGNNSSASAGGVAGTPGSFDFAGVFGNNLTADATGGNFLFVTAPSLAGSTAADATAAVPSDDFGLGDLLNAL